jgi:hypothetical protein
MLVGCDWLDLTIQADVPLRRIRRDLITVDTGERISSAVFPYQAMVRDYDESGSTKITIRPGRTEGEIYLSGNVGRWGKLDNVFQPSPAYTLTHLLPLVLLTAGAKTWDFDTLELHRIDLCELVALDQSQVYRYISWASGQSLGRLRPSTESAGCYWGRRSTHRTVKIYDKIHDLRRRGLNELADKLQAEFGGLVRREVQLRRTLKTYDMTRFDDWAWDIHGICPGEIMQKQFEQLDAGGISYEEAIADIETRKGRTVAGYVSMWRDGVDLARVLPDRSFRRIKAQVRAATGIDLSLPPDVTRLSTRIVEVHPVRVSAPVWYEITPTHAPRVAG